MALSERDIAKAILHENTQLLVDEIRRLRAELAAANAALIECKSKAIEETEQRLGVERGMALTELQERMGKLLAEANASIDSLRIQVNCGGVKTDKVCSVDGHVIYGPYHGTGDGIFLCEFHSLSKQLAESNAELQKMSCGHPRICEDESATASTEYVGKHGETVVSGCGWCAANAACDEAHSHVLDVHKGEPHSQAVKALRSHYEAAIANWNIALKERDEAQAESAAMFDVLTDALSELTRGHTNDCNCDFCAASDKDYKAFGQPLLDRLARVEALSQFAQHLPTCEHTMHTRNQCTCGYETALRGEEKHEEHS